MNRKEALIQKIKLLADIKAGKRSKKVVNKIEKKSLKINNKKELDKKPEKKKQERKTKK